MSFAGNYIDLIVVGLWLLWIYDGWERGFVVLAIELSAFVGSFVFGLRFYSRAAYLFFEYFSLTRGFANALGFFLVYALAHSIIFILLVDVLKKFKLKRAPTLRQKLFGILPAAINGLIVIAALLTLAIGLPIRGEIKQAIFESQVGGYLVRRTGNLDQVMDQVFGDAIDESMAFLTIKPLGDERVDLGIETENLELVEAPELEAQMYELVNKERKDRGVRELGYDGEIASVAREYARDMFARSYFSHISPEGEDVADRLTGEKVDFVLAGENLAFAPSLALAHEGLMQSEGHRENILAQEFGRIGIGVIDGGVYGVMFVQVFAD